MRPMTPQEKAVAETEAISRQVNQDAEKHVHEFYRARKTHIEHRSGTTVGDVIGLLARVSQMGGMFPSTREVLRNIEYAIHCIESGRYAVANLFLFMAAARLVMLLVGSDKEELVCELEERGFLPRPSMVRG